MTNDDDRVAVEGEKTRRRRQNLWLLTFAVAVGLLAGGVVVLDGGATWGWLLVAGGVLIGPAGLVMTLRYRPNAVTERVQRMGSYRDTLQRDRAQAILIMPLTSLFVTYKSVEASWEILSGASPDVNWVMVPLGPMMAILTLLMVAGLDNLRDHRLKRLLEDELILSFRQKALGTAFMVLVVGLIGVFALSLWRPAVGIAAIPLLLAIVSTVAAVRFSLLNRQADPNG